MESILFGLFVIAIMCDQFSAIFADETQVEQVSRPRSIVYSHSSRVRCEIISFLELFI